MKYDRIDISEGTDFNRKDRSKECMLCHYCYFLNKNFSYGPYLCDGYYNIMQKSVNFKNIAIVRIGKSACRIYFPYISKHEAKKSMINSNLIDKMGILWMVMNKKYENENENENEIMNLQKNIFLMTYENESLLV